MVEEAGWGKDRVEGEVISSNQKTSEQKEKTAFAEVNFGNVIVHE